MGLDMYLNKKTYVGANDAFNKVKGSIKLTKQGWNSKTKQPIEKEPIKIKFKRVTYIEEEVMYWRKARDIHEWFVENLYESVENCRPSHVTRENLYDLIQYCQGQIEFAYDDYEKKRYKDTVKEIGKILKEDDNEVFYYEPSW